MYEKVEKSKENKSRAVANAVGQRKGDGKQGIGFEDNRSEAVSQRKFQQSVNSPKYVLQQMAWTKTRPLGEPELMRPLTEDQANPPENLKDVDLKRTVHKWHEHIIFDHNQSKLGGNDNIGFHSSGNPIKGPGELFAEDVGAHTYSVHKKLSRNNKEDEVLIKAMNTNNPPGGYNVLTHNCQDWVKAVTQTFYGYLDAPESEPLLVKDINVVRH